jgi:hypothetical protein
VGMDQGQQRRRGLTAKFDLAANSQVHGKSKVQKVVFANLL